MSQKKIQRVTGIPTVPLTQTGFMNVDRMDDVYGDANFTQREPDPLDELEREKRRDQLEEFKRIKEQRREIDIKKELATQKKELKEIEMEQSEDGSWSGKLPNLRVQDVDYVAKMAPEDQQKFVQAYALFQNLAATKVKDGSQNPILAMMAATGGFGGGQKGLGVKEVMDIAGMFNGIYSGAGKGDSDMTKQLLLNLMTTTLPQWQNSAINNMQMAYQAQISQLQQNQADPLRDLEYGKKLADSLGYKPVSASNEIEKSRLEMENLWKIKEFEMKTNELNYSRQMGIIQQILNSPIVTELAKVVTRGAPALAPTPQLGVNPLSQAETQPSIPGAKKPATLIKYVCPNPACGAEIIAPMTETSVTCTQCGGTYVVDPKATLDRVMKGGQQ